MANSMHTEDTTNNIKGRSVVFSSEEKSEVGQLLQDDGNADSDCQSSDTILDSPKRRPRGLQRNRYIVTLKI